MKKLACICLCLSAVFNIAFAGEKLAKDRWIEMDLYWFDKANMQESADQFWQRYHPLFENIDGWKGVVINMGWTSGYILDWHGDLGENLHLSQSVAITMKPAEGEPPLTGTTEERMKQWEERFAKRGKQHTTKIPYPQWTYGDLKVLISHIKTAAEKYGLKDIKVGSRTVAWLRYGRNKVPFSEKHPESFVQTEGWRNPVLDCRARLTKDETSYGAFPDGIKEGLRLTEFFGKQWGNMSKRVGLDCVLLADSFFGAGIYIRKGPYGLTAPDVSAKVTEWSDATAELVKQTKLGNTNALVIGYSSAASAVADWRINCLDIEKLANDGYLDAYMDQTWSGAWNETGLRARNFWNNPLVGWTYQMGNMLLHGAMFAESNVRHYFLTETFDAWETWDVLHSAKERLAWGIWAYSHAAVKTPRGLKVPVGSYISWGNRGKHLMSEEDVRFLAETTDSALRDAEGMFDVYGPTLVYCRSAMEWTTKNAPEKMIDEWIDEQAGAVMKWGVPIMSVTRSEYLPKGLVESDLFLFQTPNHLQTEEKKAIFELIGSGKPVSAFGSFSGGMDSDILKKAGLGRGDEFPPEAPLRLETGFLHNDAKPFADGIPKEFPIYEEPGCIRADEDSRVLYEVNGMPQLVLDQTDKLMLWDPPSHILEKYKYPLDHMLGSVYPYVLAARALNHQLAVGGSVYATGIKPLEPISTGLWRSADGSYRLLAGNLEEGINHSAERTAWATLHLPKKWRVQDKPKRAWGGGKCRVLEKGKLELELPDRKCVLMKF